jgi:serine protease Do
MKSCIMKAHHAIRRHLAVSMIALAMVGSLVGYETLRPMAAKAAMAPAAAPLDDASVSPLLSLDRAMETLAARVTPAIVNIAVTSKTKPGVAEGDMPEEMPRGFGEFFDPRMFPHSEQPQIEHVGGSGVIISPDGYIVTNQHVVDGAVEIRVTLSNRRILSAKLVGSDPLTDLAVLKVEGKDLPSVPWGNSADLHPGQTVLAFGNPFGFRFTVTRGIVSALNRPNPYANDPHKPGGFIQTDAAINQGNSGGPLVDVRGEVVGINTFLISPSGAFSGMGFAIPSQIAQPTVETLIHDGKVTHAYLGIGISDVTPENAKFFKAIEANGAVITQVEPDSPAAKSGLKVGDVITEFEGRKIADATELQVAVGERRPGTTIKLGLLRDGKTITLPVTLEAMGSHLKATNEVGENGHPKMRWGLGLADLTSGVREQLEAPSELQGAVIAGVEPGSPADDAGLHRGDVITQVNRKNVESASDIQKALSSVPKGEDALVLIWSNGGSSFRVLHAPGA